MKRICRNETGQVGWMLCLLLIPVIIGLGAFAVDTMHVVSTQKELQAAVDAGALAGAMHVDDNNSDKAWIWATSITAANAVENVSVSNDSPNTTVSVESRASTLTEPGSVTVVATRKVDHLFARMFGFNCQTIKASAMASGVGALTQLPAGQAFPLAISIDAAVDSANGPAHPPLQERRIGEQFVICLGPNNRKNAGFTSFKEDSANNNYIKAAIDESLQITQSSSLSQVPAVAIGMNINLNNGEGAFEHLRNGSPYSAMLTQPFVIFPLIEGSSPFNQARPVIGFVAMKVTSIARDNGAPTITGTIVRPAVRGQSDISVGSNYSHPKNIMAPLTVRIIR